MTDTDVQERVLKDAEQMIPRTKANLDKAVEELEDLVVGSFDRLGLWVLTIVRTRLGRIKR
jgi:hypothetical protein